MTAIPLRISSPDKWSDAERAAEEALARFHAEWPVDRTRDLAAAAQGDEAASLRLAARALEKRRAETAADAAVLGMVEDFTHIVKAHRVYNREFGR